ncbi:MAG: transcriptional repressor NrdR [Armatimonadetes bacterium]|nr:transcriptional repressor NrdR [Armatimonadota bacterium]
MKCPFCEHMDTRVLDSRETDDNTSIRRRRECQGCLRRFTTYERYEETSLKVVKKNTEREEFDRSKVLRGIANACRKRPVTVSQQEAIVNSIERDLRHRGEGEVSSRQIGELVMQYLKGLDPVAYVRFASVYKEFKDVSRFADELKTLAGRTVPAVARPDEGRTAEVATTNESAPSPRGKRR